MKDSKHYIVQYSYFDQFRKHDSEIDIYSEKEPSQSLIEECVKEKWHKKGYKDGVIDSIDVVNIEEVI